MVKKITLTTENYFMIVKVKSNRRDGEYFEFMFSRKGNENQKHHSGIRIMERGENIIEETLFFLPRKTSKSYDKKVTNIKTGEILSETKGILSLLIEEIGAKIHYSTRWDPDKRKLYLEKISLEDLKNNEIKEYNLSKGELEISPSKK